MPVSVFAQNAVSMIGLGVGVDYALFLVSRFRQELNDGAPAAIAALNASSGLGRALVFSGLTVAIGFLSLFLVNARFLHSLALGGVMVVAVSLAATLTLLPALLSYFGGWVNWPRTLGSPSRGRKRFEQWWGNWARSVMRRPWLHVIPAFMVLAILIAPVPGLKVWNVGARDLDAQMEARQGLEMLDGNFSAGWMGPVILVLQRGNSDLLHSENREAMLALASRLGVDRRVASVEDASSADGKTGLIILITKQAPESDEVKDLVAELRRDAWREIGGAGINVQVGGATAMVADFDEEMLGSLRRVIPAVLALTFVALLILFKSLLIPLKAIALNLLSVLAAYGFLIYVFQDGIGAGLIGLDPPGGLNSLVVLMLFTILFGLSMDYEVFLLTHIGEEYRRSADNAASVAAGLRRTAGLITSAAFIMVCLFASFGFTRLTATREFGLGLAFAVFLDATLIRVLLVPALMELFGSANWWVPAWVKRML
jgi:RND superfamily putative drug exporter